MVCIDSYFILGAEVSIDDLLRNYGQLSAMIEVILYSLSLLVTAILISMVMELSSLIQMKYHRMMFPPPLPLS